jgi:hypothetical protein
LVLPRWCRVHTGAMIDIGEDLVGAYLAKVGGCSVVQFNVRTQVRQAEIDVVGLTLKGDRVTHVWLCEVSTHTGGLRGYGGDAAGKIRTKLDSVRAYADDLYPGVPRRIEVWSPRVQPAMLARLDDAWGRDAEDVQLVVNDVYADRVRELADLAGRETALNDSPSFRLLQILMALPSSPLART